MNDAIRRLVPNALHNLAALVVPVVVGFAATPFIVHRLGDERFGLYMLVLSVVGVAGLIDLGLGTASVKFVAERRAQNDRAGLSHTVNALLASRVPLGVLLVWMGQVSAPFVCSRVLLVPSTLAAEGVFLVRVASVTLAVSTIGGMLAALPRAVNRFDVASRLSLFASLTGTSTVVALLVGGFGLRAIVVAECIIAVAHLAASWWIARWLLPEWRFSCRVDLRYLGRLTAFGGHVAVGILTGVILAHVNRLVVGRLFGVAAVTYYAVPWNVSARVLHVVSTLAEALLPAASGLAGLGDTVTLRALYRRSLRLMAIAAGTLAVPLFVGGPDLLELWLGRPFAERASPTLRILAASAGVQSLGVVPYFILNGIGRPGWGSMAVILGITTNLSLVTVLAAHFAMRGIAFAILLGLAIQTLALMAGVDSVLRMPRSSWWTLARPVGAAVLAAFAGVCVTSALQEPWLRLLMGSSTAIGVLHLLLALTGCYERREFEFIRDTLSLRGAGRSSAA